MLENHSDSSPFLFNLEELCCATFLCVDSTIQEASPQVPEIYWYHDPLSSSGCIHSSDYPAYMLNNTGRQYLFDSEDSCCDHDIDICKNPNMGPTN